MTRSIFILFFLLAKFFCYSQTPDNIIYKYKSRRDSVHYSKTNFGLVDTLDRWCYSINLDRTPSNIDSAKPLCRVSFTRFVPLSDSAGYYNTMKKLNKNDTLTYSFLDSVCKEWIIFNPAATFTIYPLKDSIAAYKISEINMRLTSTVPPGAGGDLFIAGPFIFVHDGLSLKCCSAFSKHEGNEDYLRPLLNFIFKDLKNEKAVTVMDLLRRLPIRQCEFK